MKNISSKITLVFVGFSALFGAFLVAPAPAEALSYGTYYDAYYNQSPYYSQPSYYSGYYGSGYGQYQYPQYSNSYYNYNPVNVSCSGVADQNGYITWTAYAYGGSGNYHYYWTGTDNPISVDVSQLRVAYQSSGSKTASVRVTSANGQTTTTYCGSQYVNIYTSYYTPYNYNYNYNYSYPYQNQYQYQYQYSYPSYQYYYNNNYQNGYPYYSY